MEAMVGVRESVFLLLICSISGINQVCGVLRTINLLVQLCESWAFTLTIGIGSQILVGLRAGQLRCQDMSEILSNPTFSFVIGRLIGP